MGAKPGVEAVLVGPWGDGLLIVRVPVATDAGGLGYSKPSRGRNCEASRRVGMEAGRAESRFVRLGMAVRQPGANSPSLSET